MKLKLSVMLILVALATSCDDTIVQNIIIEESQNNSIDSINTFLGTPIRLNSTSDNEIIVIDDFVYSFNTDTRTINWTAFEYSHHWKDHNYKYEARSDYFPHTKLDENIPEYLQYDVIYGDGWDADNRLYPSSLIPPLARSTNPSSVNLFTLNVPMRTLHSSKSYRPMDEFFSDLRGTVDYHGDRSSQWYTGPLYETGLTSVLRGDTLPVPDYVWSTFIIFEWDDTVKHGYTIWESFAILVPWYTTSVNRFSYHITIDSLEKRIGYDLFSNLPDSIETKYEANSYYGKTIPFF